MHVCKVRQGMSVYDNVMQCRKM